MDVSLFLCGLLIGLAVAAPVGPIGLLCLRRTLAAGPLTGLLTGLGAAIADAIYGVIAGFGLTTLSGFLIEQQAIIRLGGGLFLCYLGVQTWRARVAGEVAAPAQGGTMLGAYSSALLLTLTNPLTIFSFTAIFAGSGLGTVAASYAESAALVFGVLLGRVVAHPQRRCRDLAWAYHPATAPLDQSTFRRRPARIRPHRAGGSALNVGISAPARRSQESTPALVVGR